MKTEGFLLGESPPSCVCLPCCVCYAALFPPPPPPPRVSACLVVCVTLPRSPLVCLSCVLHCLVPPLVCLSRVCYVASFPPSCVCLVVCYIASFPPSCVCLCVTLPCSPVVCLSCVRIHVTQTVLALNPYQPAHFFHLSILFSLTYPLPPSSLLLFILYASSPFIS